MAINNAGAYVVCFLFIAIGILFLVLSAPKLRSDSICDDPSVTCEYFKGRFCTCGEVDQCESTVVAAIPNCWSTCRSNHLPGNNTELEDCVPKMDEEVLRTSKCVRTRLSGFCLDAQDADPALDAMSQVTDAPPFAFGTNDSASRGPYARKVRAASANIHEFKVCVLQSARRRAPPVVFGVKRNSSPIFTGNGFHGAKLMKTN
ncbi:hypothetical protein AAVH_18239 [Aphelenchoides avenae]|nr:hypothetical protein AAVH_18239 [Aphelenchus avenae]